MLKTDFKGFTSQYNEKTLTNLTIKGKIPEWLSGNFISNGPTQKDSYYPGEAIFVARDNATAEDDGVLLSIVYNANTGCSLLAIIDAITMQEIAEVYLPFHLPFGLHGNFYQETPIM
jgi:carotenoid cleavage dioxygenase-like enzyme